MFTSSTIAYMYMCKKSVYLSLQQNVHLASCFRCICYVSGQVVIIGFIASYVPFLGSGR